MLACVAAFLAQQPAFRSSVTVVTIDAYAHVEGRPIDGLTAADFRVRDNDVEQQIASIGTTDSAHVIVGLDLSSSVDGETFRRLQEGVRTIVDRLTPSDRITLFTFADRLRILARAAVPDATLAATLDHVSARGSTTLHDAVLLGSVLARVEAGGRPSVFLLFTDGMETTSWTTARDAVDAVRRSDVVIYPVGAGLPVAVLGQPTSAYFTSPTWTAPSNGDALRLLEDIARLSGGEFLRVERQARFAETFGRILRQYRQRYILTFTPSETARPGWHRLDVTLRNRPGRVVAREGYVAQ